MLEMLVNNNFQERICVAKETAFPLLQSAAVQDPVVEMGTAAQLMAWISHTLRSACIRTTSGRQLESTPWCATLRHTANLLLFCSSTHVCEPLQQATNEAVPGWVRGCPRVEDRPVKHQASPRLPFLGARAEGLRVLAVLRSTS